MLPRGDVCQQNSGMPMCDRVMGKGMNKISENRGSDKRSQLRERNREALVEATLDCVAELGIARSSVSEIIARAGLSRGMIHLHFETKDNLLKAAMERANEVYYGQLEALLCRAGSSPPETIDAVVRSDLSEEVLNRRYISIWYAFRGEAREREMFRRLSDTRDERMRTLIYDAFLPMLRAQGTPDAELVARDATDGLIALLEGMWNDFLLHPDEFDRDQACRVAFRFIAALLPAHFTAAGAVRRACAR